MEIFLGVGKNCLITIGKVDQIQTRLFTLKLSNLLEGPIPIVTNNETVLALKKCILFKYKLFIAAMVFIPYRRTKEMRISSSKRLRRRLSNARRLWTKTGDQEGTTRKAVEIKNRIKYCKRKQRRH